MNLKSEKLLLVERILQTKDENAVHIMNQILDVSENDPYDEYPDALKKSIERGLNDIKAGNTIAHQEAMKKYKQCFQNHLDKRSGKFFWKNN